MEREERVENREIETLLTPEVRAAIEANIERDPNEIALSKGVPEARLVATQVKYLQRARRKLPSYYNARAIFTPLAFEQSSSEECAAHKRFEGDVVLDMTCGLGVDSLYLSKRFRRVIACERNEELATITRHNLALLGAENVEVVSEDAERVLEGISHVDLIYADPDRRSAEGKKMVCLEECSPNIAALLPTLKERADHLAVKLSPMFDVTEALVRFGEGSDVEVISLGGEVKEVVVYWSKGATESHITATALGAGEFAHKGERTPSLPTTKPFNPEEYKFLVVPDASLRKAGLVAEWCRSEGLDCYGSYGFSAVSPLATMGRIYNIKVSVPYQPKQIKKRIPKGAGIQIIRHSFPLSSSAICKALGTREGAGSKWAFAEIEKSLWAFEIED